MWHIDGSHSTLEERGYGVPALLKKFQGYNTPQNHRHRKRSHTNLSREMLVTHSQTLFSLLTKDFWSKPAWQDMKKATETLARSLASYADLLIEKRSRMELVHNSPEVVRTIGENLTVRYTHTRVQPPSYLSPLSDAVMSAGLNVPVEIGQMLPTDRRQKYDWVEEIRKGLRVPLVHVTYSPGSNVGNVHWIWQSDATSIDSALQKVQPIIEHLKQKIPQYHTRAMRREAYAKFGLVTATANKSVLRHLYKDFVCDSSASANLSESEIDARVNLMFELEDPSLVYDLRHHFAGRQAKFDTFWDEAKKLIQEDVGVAVDDRRHSTVVHIAKALSVRDLREQVVSRCPEGTPIPSDEWIRLQFAPASLSSNTALRYTGKLEVKRQVQQRQFRKGHPDSHYAACLFRYQRKYAIEVRDYAVFVCLDDKHKIKVGEPHSPVAAAERGRQVIVPTQARLQACDHDFTKFGIVPSVTLIVDIPDEISGSWYHGEVKIMFKDTAFESSSPIRHSTELCNILITHSPEKPILFIYTDGGPDHRVTYTSVKLSLICLFKKMDLDYLCAMRTAPYQSYRNPVERIMAIVNLGLQAIAIARREMPREMEEEAERCNSLKALRAVASRNSEFQGACLDSVAPVKKLLTDIALRLELKEKKFQVFVAATPAEIDDLWSALLSVDTQFSLARTDKCSVKDLTSNLSEFMTHCCRERHYFFDVLKCGIPECQLCSPVRLPQSVFNTLRHLPDPMPGVDNHYKPCSDVFKTETTEQHRPSLQKKTKQDKGLPFSPSVQHVHNTDMMLQCEECGQWRLIYSKKKLSRTQKQQLERVLDHVSYSCGTQLQDYSEFPQDMMDVVFTRHLFCNDPVERLYYSAKFADICLHCSSESVSPWADTEEFYPQSEGCSEETKIPNVKALRRKTSTN